MDPNSINLENVNKMFEYEKLSREIDTIDDVNELRNIAKAYVRLYLKQQEVVAKL